MTEGIKEMVRVVQPGGHERSFTDLFSVSAPHCHHCWSCSRRSVASRDRIWGAPLVVFGLGCGVPFNSPTTFHAPIAPTPTKHDYYLSCDQSSYSGRCGIDRRICFMGVVKRPISVWCSGRSNSSRPNWSVLGFKRNRKVPKNRSQNENSDE